MKKQESLCVIIIGKKQFISFRSLGKKVKTAKNGLTFKEGSSFFNHVRTKLKDNGIKHVVQFVAPF